MSKGRAASGEGSVFKAKDGRWNAFVTIGRDENGKLKRKRFTGKTQAAVVDKKKAYEASLGINSTIIANNLHLDELMPIYLKKKLDDPNFKPTSYDRDLRTWNKQIKPKLGHYLLKDITSDIIQNELINYLINQGYSYSTIHKSFVLLHETIKFAVKKRYIANDPCSDVSVPEKKRFGTKKIRFLKTEEVAAFIDAANSQTVQNKDYKYGNILCLIIYTGLRGGELCALKWQDVNYDTKMLNISRDTAIVYEDDKNNPKKRNRKRVEQHTKNGEEREVPLNEKAIDILNKQKKLVGGAADDYIVNGCRNIVVVSDLDKCYKFIAKKAMINNPQGVHVLRHTFATTLIRNGKNIKDVSELLGHSDVAFTLKTYVHSDDDSKRDAVDSLSSI